MRLSRENPEALARRRSLAKSAAKSVLYSAAVASFVAGPVHAGLIETIERVKPSIVVVGVYKRTGSPPLELKGTGFAVGVDNLVATNAHVVTAARDEGEDATLVVKTVGGDGEEEMRPAKLVGSDHVHDLALLRFSGKPLPKLKLGDSERVREGAAIAFTGFPIGGALGFTPVTHRGTVSAITAIGMPSPNAKSLNERLVRALKDGPFNVFQLDATAYPGNSGGPLYDPDSGEVVGVVNMVFVKGSKESALSQPSGISYAIPSRHLAEMIEALIRQGAARR